MRNPGLAAQLRTQHEETVQFMKAKFEPELSGGSLVAQNAALANPEAAKGKAIFEREGCNACHGDNGIGTSAGPKLIGIGSKYDAPKLETLVRTPTEKMTSGVMQPVGFTEDEMTLPIESLQSFK